MCPFRHLLGDVSTSLVRWLITVRWPVCLVEVVCLLATATTISAGASDTTTPSDKTAPSEADLAFYESRIRPVLSEHCYSCHSDAAQPLEANLRLDRASGWLNGGASGPTLVPGDVESSLLIRAIRHTDATLKMPEEGPLPAEVIADLEEWVRRGAPAPSDAAPSKEALQQAEAKGRWAFQAPISPPIPQVEPADWPLNPVDHFVRAKQQARGLVPLGLADRRTLIRRATYDLIGLPPTPSEVDAFCADSSPEAYTALIDRLLESPHYGERWGRYWLDVVRYSDTAGDNSDYPIPQMYRYRNWVIDVFNRDLPYDEFLRQQLAGDLLPAADEATRQQQVIATGYLANARRFGSRVDDYPWHLTIEDTLDNLGRAVVGLSLNCARCHDHKFDPVSTEDYCALYGFFSSTRYPWPGIELEQKQRDLVPLIPAAQYQQLMDERTQSQAKLDAEVARLEEERRKLPADQQHTLNETVDRARKTAHDHSQQPLPFELAYAVADATQPQDVALQFKGDPLKPGPVVRRRFPVALGGFTLPPATVGSGRLQLAQWLTSRDNPLTARVMVNRLWGGHFGRGIIPTPNDFGRQGKPATHPELLDWLAVQFMERGWSIKSMHRLLMLSRTYQLECIPNPALNPLDPTNEYFCGASRRRLDAEALRDSLLDVSGLLDRTQPQAHPFPTQTQWNYTQHNPFKAVYDSQHRSVYLMTQRIQRHPYLAMFDGPDPSVSTPARTTSTSPLQALYLLNNDFIGQQSTALAKRLINECSSDAARLDRAYLLVLSRPPSAAERQQCHEFLEQVHQQLRAESPTLGDAEREQGAWASLARVLFRLNEFLYVD